MKAIYVTLIQVAVVALVGAAIGWGINGWRLGAQVEKAKAEFSEAKANAYQEALTRMQTDLKRMAAASEGNTVKTANIDRDLDNIMKELKHAKPLPVDCRLDDFRVQSLAAAVADLQRTLAGAKSGTTVRNPGVAK